MGIAEKLQIKNSTVVLSATRLAVLLGRKHLSVLRGIDALPAQYLREGMFILDHGEVFLSSTGICMLDMSKRHLPLKIKMILAMGRFEDAYKAAVMADFHSKQPPMWVIKLILKMGDVGLTQSTLWVYRVACLFTGFSPERYKNDFEF